MFYENFCRLCNENNISPNAAAKEIGLSNSVVTYWKRGSIPKANVVQRVADYFHVTTDELLNGEEAPPSKLHRERGVKIGVLSSVGAGIPLEAVNTFDQDDPDSWEEISQLDASKGEYFALRIRGNSMEPEIKHGDLVVVRCSEEFEDGDWVIALVNGDEGVCKILRFRDDGIGLHSLNTEYPPMIFTREQISALPVRLIGIVEEVRHKVRRL